MGTLHTRFQNLILKTPGQKPLKAPEGIKPGDAAWDNSYIMVGEWFDNQPDDIWYYNNGVEVKAFGNVGNEIINTENTALYDALRPNDANGFAYYAGKNFVTYVNAASANPDFHEVKVYLCIENALIGESPESHPLKWDSKGDTVEVERGSLSKLFYNSTSAIREITDYKNGDNAIDSISGIIYTYSETATAGLQPLNNANASGRWVAGQQIPFGGGDATSRSYTIDFLTTTIVAQDINMFGAAVIDNIVASNVASILLTYSGGLQQVITPGENAIAITAGDILTWEITRTNAGQLAALGIHLSLNE